MNKKIEKPRVVAMKLTDEAMKGLIGGALALSSPRPPPVPPDPAVPPVPPVPPAG